MWAFDFQFDQTAEGRALKLLNVVDEFTRESLAMLVARNIDADKAVSVLQVLAAERGAPELLRCDNGPEMTGHALRDWCELSKARTAFIEPGSPSRRKCSRQRADARARHADPASGPHACGEDHRRGGRTLHPLIPHESKRHKDLTGLAINKPQRDDCGVRTEGRGDEPGDSDSGAGGP